MAYSPFCCTFAAQGTLLKCMKRNEGSLGTSFGAPRAWKEQREQHRALVMPRFTGARPNLLHLQPGFKQ
jgi:hypothetical protein